MNQGFQILTSTAPISVAIINLPNALVSSILGIQDVFHIANTFCIADKSRLFSVQIVQEKESIVNFQSNVPLKTTSLDLKQNFDVIIIPPIISDVRDIKVSKTLNTWLNLMYAKGSYICSVCVGTYVLASVGLLDNIKATTHWSIEQNILDTFPLVLLDIDRIVIEDKNIITAGGISAYLDLSLYLIRKYFSILVAYECANFLVVDAGRTSQKHYKNLASLSTELEPELKELLAWIKININQVLTLAILAKQMHVSERTLMRIFKKKIGILPTKYLQNIRVQMAKELLINSQKSIEQITFNIGYEDIPSFRRLFKKKTGLSPGEYRNIFMVKF
ncbi:Transcriptional regulator, AraC family [hydrothermal vent metagenome]|uniref:Transcriptional regulator, AraC family n=1 Tax=hydrothermal vent metagenome TaxID=652676 RepID=A0A1W1CTP1_9ZZZZ